MDVDKMAVACSVVLSRSLSLMVIQCTGDYDNGSRAKVESKVGSLSREMGLSVLGIPAGCLCFSYRPCSTPGWTLSSWAVVADGAAVTGGQWPVVPLGVVVPLFSLMLF